MRSLLFIFAILASLSYRQDIVDLNQVNTAETIYDKVLLLEERYSDIIDVKELGMSTDGRPIYVVKMTSDVAINNRVPEGYVEKMHFFYEAGIHSRENPGPNIVLKMIEDYAKDYYKEGVIPDYSLKSILSDNVLHFIVLSNPDGYNLSTRGLYTISKPYQDKLLSFRDKDYRSYKANINGVDLNRNFPGYYYDLSLESWRNIWNLIHNDFRSYYPGGAFYFGPFEASEIETRLMMDYVLSYDFRNYISFHSKGQVIYSDKWMLSDLHNERSQSLALAIEEETGYDIIEGSRYTSSSGYLTDYTAMNTLKPSITVETIHWKHDLPVNTAKIREAYEEVKYVPLLAVAKGQEAGYFDYKWYKDGVYIRDFEELEYALAFYNEYGGHLLRYPGQPKYYFDFERNKVTRLELIREVMNYVSSDKVSSAYKDCDDVDVLKAKHLGIISDVDYFRPDDFATYEETFVILSKAFYSDYQVKETYDVDLHASWAVESLKVLIENQIVDYAHIFVGRIDLGDLRSYLRLIEKLQGE